MPIWEKVHCCSYLVPQDTLRRPLGRSLRPSVTPRPWNSVWKEKCAKTLVFFSKSAASDYFRRRVAKATCTKYRACAQKLSAVFRGAAGIGPWPLITNTARTPTDKSVWENGFSMDTSHNCRYLFEYQSPCVMVPDMEELFHSK